MERRFTETTVLGNDFPRYCSHTFLWMMAGLLITALTSFLVLSSGLWIPIFTSALAPILLLVLQLVVVFTLTGRMMHLQPNTVRLLFAGYSVLTGVNLSVLPLAYGVSTMFIAFGYTALMFGCMAVIGATTKRDLSKIGTLLLAGLLTIIIMNVVNLFLHLDGMAMMMNYITVLVFLGLTAYDMQKIKAIYQSVQYNEDMLKKSTIYCALELYLDFINIFLSVLRIFGSSRDN